MIVVGCSSSFMWPRSSALVLDVSERVKVKLKWWRWSHLSFLLLQFLPPFMVT